MTDNKITVRKETFDVEEDRDGVPYCHNCCNTQEEADTYNLPGFGKLNKIKYVSIMADALGHTPPSHIHFCNKHINEYYGKRIFRDNEGDMVYIE